MSESMWIERAQSAEAKLKALQEACGPAIERVKEFKKNFGVKERSNGEIDVDFEQFVKGIGSEGALALKDALMAEYEIETPQPKEEKPKKKKKKKKKKDKIVSVEEYE